MLSSMIGELMSSAALQAARDGLAALHGMPEVEEVKDSAESKVPHRSTAAVHPLNCISSFLMHQTAARATAGEMDRHRTQGCTHEDD